VARTVERATTSYADEATQQFAALIKSSREDAARRLARELDRAVETFAREAEVVLAERLAHVGDAGAQRLEKRLDEAANALERQRDEWMTALDSRIGEMEHDVRRRLEELGADADAERAVLEARLQELLRRIDATAAVRSP
jgi:DNA anti-recombination protein RmuC